MSSRKILVGVSILGHVVLFAGVFVTNVWEVDPLEYEHRVRLPIAVIGAPANEGGSLDRPKVELKPKPKPVKETVQPRVRKPQEPVAETPTAPDGGPGNGPPGDGPPGDGPPGACTATDGSCDPAAPTPDPEPVQQPTIELPKPTIEKPRIVPPTALVRISGETNIRPPSHVAHEIARTDARRTSAALMVCVSAEGTVMSVTVRKSTSYPAYDEALVSAARRWTYQPYSVGGKALPVCTSVTFQYQMN
jgi:protein TonB